MGEMGGDDFARGTARGIEAAMGERAARAELVAQELGKEVAELRAALAAAQAANGQHTSPAPGEMGAQSGGETGTRSEMGGSDAASTKTQSTETASPRTPDFFGEGEPTEASAATQTPALCLLGNLPGGGEGHARRGSRRPSRKSHAQTGPVVYPHSSTAAAGRYEHSPGGSTVPWEPAGSVHPE